MNKITKAQIDERAKNQIVNEVVEDYKQRREIRKSLERQWQLNINYIIGNQYCEISPTGDIKEQEKYYGWQSRNVFNHIAPIVDTRLAKLTRVRPIMSVRAAGGDESDIKTAETSSDILRSTYQRVELDTVISTATSWSESCGTAFYKVTWDSEKGKILGNKDGANVNEGDVEVTAVSPFEIFPDSLYHVNVNDCKSIIHARAVDVNDIFEKYGVAVQGEEVDVFTLGESNSNIKQGYSAKNPCTTLKNHTVLIEKYIAPNLQNKNGRLIIVAGNQLLYDGELPFENGVDGKRCFPFVKQVCISQPGAFFGVSVVERLIPLQRAYNAVKNRKYEFMNRVSMGILNVEDGSIDTDDLADEGLSPGKIIVYRQGSRPPQMMNSNSIPNDFINEEERLSSEFVSVSGTSEVSRSSETYSTTLSGVAIQLLIDQDETRMSITTESIKSAVKEVGKHILRLFKQFATSTRIMKSAGNGKFVKTFYFTSSDISSDDIVFDTESGLTQTPAQKKAAVLEILNSGLLGDDKGVLTSRTKAKILDILGYGSLDNTHDIINLHRNKAEKENIDILHVDVQVDDYDDHLVHIEEHLRKILENDVLAEKDIDYLNRLKEHYNMHQEALNKSKVLKELTVND